jgi:hypothetical protein
MAAINPHGPRWVDANDSSHSYLPNTLPAASLTEGPGAFLGYTDKEVDSLLSYKLAGRVTMQISRGCRRQCIICGVDAAKKPVHMPFKDIQKTLGFLKTHGIKGVYLYMDSEPLEYRDYREGKDIADVLTEINKLGMNTGLTTHGWNPGDEESKAAARSIASLPFQVDMTVSMTAYHPDVLAANTNDEVEKAIMGHLRHYEEIVETFFPQKPQIQFVSTHLSDQQEGREFWQVSRAENMLMGEVNKRIGGKWKDMISGVRNSPVLWNGRAYDILKRHGMEKDLIESHGMLFNEQPVLVMRPTGELEFVLGFQKERQFEKVGRVFKDAEDPDFRRFSMILQTVLETEIARRSQSSPPKVVGDFVETFDESEIKRLNQMGAGIDVGNKRDFTGEVRFGLIDRDRAYIYESIYFACSKSAPTQIASSEINPQGLTSIYNTLKDIPMPLELGGALLEFRIEDPEQVLPQHYRTLWDFRGKVDPDQRGTMKHLKVGRFL